MLLPQLLLASLLQLSTAQDFMSMFAPFIGSGLAAAGGGGGGGGGGAGQFLGAMSSFMPLLGGGGNPGENNPFGSIFSMLNRVPPRPAPRPAPAPAPAARPQPQPSTDDYEDDIDLSLTGAHNLPEPVRSAPPPPPNRFRPARYIADPAFSSPARRNPIQAFRITPITDRRESFARQHGVVTEISALSSVHQRPNGDYGSVEKILQAFGALFEDPRKPKRAMVADATEVGRNRALSAHLFESDIVLTVPQMKGIVLSEKDRRDGRRRRYKRKVITGSVYRWPKGRPIPYRFKGSDPYWRRLIEQAMGVWSSETCLRFAENYVASDYILFYKGSGCFSSVGKTGGSQMISIGNGCEHVGIISHEIAHTLGFWHEQSRPDRDYYINIRSDYISAGTEMNFLKQSYEEADSMGLSYDLGSIMHYGPEAFSTRSDQVTIETKDPRYESTIGQRIRPSFIDVKQMNRLYCNDACSGVQLPCQHGGYPDPNSCLTCKCPEGLAGPTCDMVDAGQCSGTELVAGTSWQELKHDGVGDCAWRIRAPLGHIRLRVSGVNFECARTCESFVEIKSSADYQATGYRVCCFENEINVVSDGQEVLILSRPASQGRRNSFKVQYVKVDSSTQEIIDPSTAIDGKGPAINPWVPGQENRAFRGVDKEGPVEAFILNSIGQFKKSDQPEVRFASAIGELALSSLFRARGRK